MRIQRNDETGEFILGQFSRPFTSIPDMIRHFCLNRLPVRGAEHMVLLDPVDAQILQNLEMFVGTVDEEFSSKEEGMEDDEPSSEFGNFIRQQM